MSWSEHHRRGDLLRTVIESLDLHRDGRLPVEIFDGIPGVDEVFADELDLVGALQLTWFQRLTGLIERHQSERPMALAAAVETAWLEAARWMPGLRILLDRCLEHPSSAEMRQALARAVARERAQLAVAAGLASAPDARAEKIGLRIERAAREQWRPGVPVPTPVPTPVRRNPTGSPAFVARLKAVLES